MTALRWDRTFETCKTASKDAILIPGFPIFLRSKWGFQPLEVSPLNDADIASMADELMPSPETRWEFASGTIFDVRHDDDCKFRVAVLGPAPTRIVILVRLSQAVPPLALAPEDQKWMPIASALSYDRILAWCVQDGRRDAILVPGCPPVVWSDSAVQAFFVPPLTVEDVSAMVKQMTLSPDNMLQEYGYSSYGLKFENTLFRAAVFGSPRPFLATLMKLPVKNDVLPKEF